MAAEKKGQTIVIKKIYVTNAHHGGSWKVALADFMTAMMAFFLVMWLIAQSEETKKAVSDYFSTPSIIEYNFENFGAELTLEKLFLDLLNDPLKAIQSFLEPVDKSPNFLDFGSQKVVAAFMADKMGDLAKNFSVSQDGIEFDLIDHEIFIPGTATPNNQYVTVMERLKTVTVGLEDSNVKIESRLFNQSVPGSSPESAKKVASERLDLMEKRIQASFEHSTNSIIGQIDVREKKGFIEGQSQRPEGMVHFSIKHKPIKSDGTKPRPLETVFGTSKPDLNAYENFVKQVTDQKSKRALKAEPQ
jgi:chemotaxis protein MotB